MTNGRASRPFIDSDSVTDYTIGMTTEDRSLLTIDDLAAYADVPVRTIRFYIAEGLLPGASTRGKGASYTQEHLERLQLIRLLVARHLPLAEIHALVTRLPPGEASAVLHEEQARAGEISPGSSKPTSPKAYISALLDQARAYPGHSVAGPSSGGAGAGSKRQHRGAPQATSPAPSAPAAHTRVVAPSPQPVDAHTHWQEQAAPWQRWELAPGIELQVRADIARTQPEMIEHALNAVRAALAHGSVEHQQKE